MKQTVNKLYNFIANLVVMLEVEVEELQGKRSKSALNIKKNITDTLNKLVHLIIQLNKLDRDTHACDEGDPSKEDQEIIKRFISRHYE